MKKLSSNMVYSAVHRAGRYNLSLPNDFRVLPGSFGEIEFNGD